MIQLFLDLNLLLLVLITITLPISIIITYVIVLQSSQNDDKYNTNKYKIPFDFDRRMKQYVQESIKITSISSKQSFLIRLNIMSYLKFATSKINTEVYSIEFKKSMVTTAIVLRKEFNASSAYTCSNEIILIFNKTSNEHIFGGKTHKILSVVSSYASTTFYKSMINEKCDLNSIPIFATKIVVFPYNKEYEILNYLICLINREYFRNFVNMYTTKFISKKSIQHISIKERIEKLKNIGYDLSDFGNIDFAVKYGVFIKNDNRLPIYFVIKKLKFSDNMLNFILDKKYDKKYDYLFDMIYNNENLNKLLNFTIQDK